ncbi:hypothetical protein ZIOFF_064033 [Zingiber officinale]|uniref:Uncharacterized protein n=1 Tax=Zingiber officinale TaxID=94328 RepID=A0A8J5ETG7_ZINOF|nr:hypothetical protein ZIOFF_064033 [Zingiber officinale]
MSPRSFYTGIGIHFLADDGKLGPEKEVHGFPDGAKINFASCSVWVNDSTLLVCTIPVSREGPPKKPLVPSGPKIQSNEQKNVVQVRTFQDLLKDEYDEDLFDYYSTTQLVLASLDGTMKSIGPPAVYTSIDSSPDEKGISWCDDSFALVYESWDKTRRTRTWVISPDIKNVKSQILFDRSSEDVYSDRGSPMMRRTQAGTYVIAKVKKQDHEGTYTLLNGRGVKERIWESDKEKYYETVVALMSDYTDGELFLDQLKILTSKESKTENTQYFLQIWPEREIRYQRKDGGQLTATLYLPPGYNPSKDGPLPFLVLNLGEFKSKDAARQVDGSPNEFAGIGPTSPLLGSCSKF